MRPEFDLSLYLVTDRSLSRERDIEWIVDEAVKGGVTIVQLREKDCSTAEFIAIASRLMQKLKPLSIPLIINDRVDVALAVNADGVHIGQSDMPYETARRLLGDDKIIGLSVETMADVVKANALDVDYIAVSPVYSTATKTDTLQPFGLYGLKKAVTLSRHRIVAIGGMNVCTVGDVMACGIEGTAVVSAIVAADSPCKASNELVNVINANRLKWSDVAFMASLPIIERMKTLPFNVELMQGTLSNEVFKDYLQQDIIYLANYGNEISALVDIIPEKSIKELFSRISLDAIHNERTLHEMLVERFDVNGTVPAIDVIGKYMLHTRRFVEFGDVGLSLAALLPCFWVYSELGRYMLTECVREDNPYFEWIETYASDFMDECVRMISKQCDDLAKTYSAERRAEMFRAFIKSVEFEEAFFENIYNK